MIKRETSEKVTLLGVVCAVMVMYIGYFLEGVLVCALCVVFAIPIRRFIPWTFGGR